MFQFEKLTGTLRSLKVDRGSSEDADVLATMCIEVENLPAQAAQYALGADETRAFVDAFFRPPEEDKDQTARFLGIAGIKSVLKLETAHRITVHGVGKVRASILRDVTIKPVAGWMSTARFTLTTHEPPESFIESLAKHIKGPITVTLEQDPQLDLKPGQPEQGELDQGDEQTRKARASAARLAAKPARKRGAKKGGGKRRAA